MKRKNEKLMISYAKKLLPQARIVSNRIDTPDLPVRDKIFVDCYLRYKDKKIILEYNGPHHFRPISYGNESLQESKQQYKEQKQRDQWLRNYCSKKNIILIEIDGRLVKGQDVKFCLINEFHKFGLI